MKISKEIKIGFIVVVTIGLFVWGFNFLKGINLFSYQRKFHAIYSNIDGLQEANPIQINGYKVGQVKTIIFLPGNSGKILVTFVINNNDILFPKNSIAKIISSDILGSKAIGIVLGNVPEMAGDNDTLASAIQANLSQEVNQQVKPLKDKAEKLISSIDSVMIVVQAVLNKDARENLSKSFESINKSIATFEHTSRIIDTMMTTERYKLSVIFSKIESITTNIATNNDNLSNIISNFSSITDSLAKANIKSTIESANKALLATADVMEKINRGEGSLGLLVNDKKLYHQLDSASSNLTILLSDIDKYPGTYIPFKRKDKRPKHLKK